MILTTTKTADLVAFYNSAAQHLGGAAVKKFADRATAEKRVAALINGRLIPAGLFCPVCDAGRPLVWVAGQRSCKHCASKIPSENKRSDATRRTWSDPAVAAARTARTAVSVDGKGKFKSVRDAFLALGLPLSGHIKFRMNLKAAGRLSYGKFVFRVTAAGA